MLHRSRLTQAHLALALTALPGVCSALGLGALRGEAYLGEPLRVEIQLVGDSTPPLGRDCVSLQRPEQTPDDGSFPRNMAARIEARANGQIIVLTTPSSVAVPILEFRVALRCGYNVSREYSLLPMPKNDSGKIGAPEPASPALPALAANPLTPKAKPPRTPRSPDNLEAVTYNVTTGMTVAQLADLHFRNQPMRRARFKRWVLEANPGLAADSRLNKGQEIAIPAGIPPRRPGDRQDPVTGEFLNDGPHEPRSRPAAASATPPPAPLNSTAPASGSSKTAAKDQLRIGGENTPPSFRNMKEAGQIIERLNTLLEQQLAATVSAEDKLGKLETSVGDMQQRLGKAEANMAAAEARNTAALQAAQNALAAQEERSKWLVAIAAGGGLILGSAVTLALVLLRRKPKQPPQFFAPSSAAPPAGTMSDATALKPPAPPATKPPQALPQEDSTAAQSVFHRAPAMAATIKTVRPSLDFRDALTTLDSQHPPLTAAAEAATPPREAARHGDIDFELEAPNRIELDPLNFAFEPPSAPLPSVFESLNITLPASPEPLPALDSSGNGIVELTNVMVSMGLAASAAETLAKHIAANPRQSLQHWLKLLEVYRLQGSREAFEKAADEMRAHFNVRAGEWENNRDLPVRNSLEDFPHLLRNLQSTWREPGCAQYIHALLTDNRQGTRTGFSQSVAEELLLLIAILSEQKA